MSVLVVAEHDNAQIKPATRNTVTAAAKLGEVVVLVAGHDCKAAAEAAAKIAGVARVLVADAALYAHPLAESLAALVAGLAKSHGHVLAPATTFGKNLMPTAPPSLSASASSSLKFSALCMPRPPETTILALVSSGRSERVNSWPTKADSPR